MGGQNNEVEFYRLSVKSSLAKVASSSDGLTAASASTRLDEYGPNKLEETKRETALRKYLRQFNDIIICLLLISSFISFAFEDARVGMALLAVVLLNTYMGFRQEYKAEKIMASLEKLVVPKARVLRGGKNIEVASTDLVVGDIVYIEEGDSVPADLRLINVSELSTNDFALTGESNPTHKHTDMIHSVVPLGDQNNTVFMGTTVATGHGTGVVCATGMDTQLGKIAGLSSDTKSDKSPLQKEMNDVGKKVAKATVGLFCLLLVISWQGELGAKEGFLFAVAVAASLVPQGLPAALSTILAQAAKKMVNDKALVKKLSAVETLGATSIICTDKTGTLTKNQMTVEELLVGKNLYTISGAGYEPKGEISLNNKALSSDGIKDLELFFATGVFASNAKISQPDDEHKEWYCLGDPTEGALITLAVKSGIDIPQIETEYPEVRQFSFDSGRKLMSSIRPWGDKSNNYVFVKGAPENVLERCDEIWDHGHIRKLTAADKKFILDHNEKRAESAMRNLSFAFRKVGAKEKLETMENEDAEKGLVYLGMVSMIDPVREEVKSAMVAARRAKIKVTIITGDYATTARAIALKAGLTSKGHEALIVSGEELKAMSDKDVVKAVKKGSTIFSRVSPEDKLRIVGLIKNGGDIVAVTGDGINDAPALKKADIGVAMGVTGTDVAKQSAEIVLLDDSFKTLVSAVRQGRTIFQNIKKVTLVAFCANASELVVSLFSLGAAALFSIPLAITVMLILAIDLIAELFPMIALGWDKAENNLMIKAPRDPRKHILNNRSIKDIVWAGLLIGSLTFANYMFFYVRRSIDPSAVQNGSELHMQATSLTYLTIMVCQLLNILHLRSEKGIFTRYQFHNRRLLFAYGMSLFCIANIIFNPWIAPFFRAGPINLQDIGTALLTGLIFVVFREMGRYGQRDHRNHIVKLHQEKAL